MRSRTILKRSITKLSNKVNRTQVEGNADSTTVHRDELIELFGEFERVNDEILKLLPADEGFDEVDAYFDKVEAAYVKTLKDSKDWLDNLDRDEVASQAQSELTSMMNIMSLPKLELKSFSGDPAEYHSFTKLFDISVASVTSSEDAKLTRLLQYTTGDAYALIKRCVLMDEGYQEARNLLAERYGSNDVVCETMIEALLSTRIIKNGKELRRFSDLVSNTQAVLSSLDRLAEVNSQRFIRSVVEKLQPYARNKWKSKVVDYKELNDAYPDFKYMCKFIHKISEAANDTYYGQYESTSTGRVSTSTSLATVTPTCYSCGGPHALANCSSFAQKDLQARLNTVRRNDLCRLCLMPGHYSFRCDLEARCATCGGDHATVVHCDAAVVANSTVSRSSVCMPIVSVRVNGMRVNAVLDTASSVTLITTGAMRRLGLRGRSADIQVETVNGLNTNKTTSVDFDIYGDQDTRVSLTGVSVMDKIPVSTTHLCLDKYPHLKGLKLFNESVQNVDILIGQDNGECLIPLDSRYGGRDEPYAVKYTFGWALGGRAVWSPGKTRQVSNLIVTHDGMQREAWETQHDCDDLGESQDDRYVTSLWDEATLLRDDKHYVIPIPFKTTACFVDNRFPAQQRLQSLVRSLRRKGLYDRYECEMRKLIDSGHAEQVVSQRDEHRRGDVWYLPHHGVVNDKKPEKLRIVFDCAAQYCGESLNDKCFRGPDLVNSLTGILLRFREHRYVLLADIECMYYQVIVPETQRDRLRFLWFGGDGSVKTYRMTTHVFGGVWCAASSTYALRRTINDDPQVSDLVRDTVLKGFYVDDCVKSAHEIEDIRSMFVDVTAQLKKGGFRLTKFLTNCEVGDEIPYADRAKETKSLGEDTSAKALGLRWNIQGDYFWFDGTAALDRSNITRRIMLSIVASTYDPLGLASPIVIVGRLLFQEATKQKLTWDEPVPPDMKLKWLGWIDSLKNFSVINIPRCLKNAHPSDVTIELHHFSDASQSAYGSCSYLRSVDQFGLVTCNLIMSKSRVAPIKMVTIPRLELQAAVLSVTLDCFIRSSMSLIFSQSYFWTDSQIVLDYIRNSNRRFPVFVSNRVAKIVTHSSPGQWNHVRGADNPADVISRGTTVERLNQDRWGKGPLFLRAQRSTWKDTFQACEAISDDPEEIYVCNAADVNAEITDKNNPFDRILHHYSSWNAMRRGLAWLRRFVAKLNKQSKTTGELSSEELDVAGVMLIKHAQQLHYGEDMVRMRSNQNIRKSCDLKALSPFIDQDGVIRVGGRLAHASLEENQPVIVPFKSPISKAIYSS